MAVATMEGTTISPGLAAPAAARRAMAVDGTRPMAALLRARKVIMAWLASPGRGLRRLSSCMVFSPKGVAALARPRKLAARLRAMALKAGWPLGTVGKRGRTKGWKIGRAHV